jgi:hypothetical protein
MVACELVLVTPPDKEDDELPNKQQRKRNYPTTNKPNFT